MNKTIKKGKQKLRVLLSHVQLSSILPFTETPSERQYDGDSKEKDNDKLQASDLFSMFTADIIKEEVIFTR